MICLGVGARVAVRRGAATPAFAVIVRVAMVQAIGVIAPAMRARRRMPDIEWRDRSGCVAPLHRKEREFMRMFENVVNAMPFLCAAGAGKLTGATSGPQW